MIPRSAGYWTIWHYLFNRNMILQHVFVIWFWNFLASLQARTRLKNLSLFSGCAGLELGLRGCPFRDCPVLFEVWRLYLVRLADFPCLAWRCVGRITDWLKALTFQTQPAHGDCPNSGCEPDSVLWLLNQLLDAFLFLFVIIIGCASKSRLRFPQGQPWLSSALQMAQYNAAASAIGPAEKLRRLSFGVRWRWDRNTWIEWKDEQGQLGCSQEHRSVRSSACFIKIDFNFTFLFWWFLSKRMPMIVCDWG